MLDSLLGSLLCLALSVVCCGYRKIINKLGHTHSDNMSIRYHKLAYSFLLLTLSFAMVLLTQVSPDLVVICNPREECIVL